MIETKEYTQFSLGMAARLPILAGILPLLAMVVMSGESYSEREVTLYLVLAFTLSFSALMYQREFRSLSKGLHSFRMIYSAFYLLFSLVIPLLFYIFNENPFAKFALTILTVILFVIFGFFMCHFYTPKYMELCGWWTRDEGVLNPEPSGSALGNKLAVILAGSLLFVLLIAIFSA